MDMEKQYPGIYSGAEIDALLRKTEQSGKPLTVTVNGAQTEYDGTQEKSVVIDTSAPVTAHDSSESAHSDIRDEVAAKYTKPAAGIPKTDLSAAVQASLGSADSAYQRPASGIPSTDLDSAAQSAIAAAGTAMQPSDIDATLAVTGKAADAKAVGDRLGSIESMVSPMIVPVRTWADVQNIVRRGMASNVFHAGDQLVCKRGENTLVWDVIGIDHDTPSDAQLTHSLTLQLHDCYDTAMQYDAREALYYCENGLAAGTYNITVGASGGYAADVGKTFQFTLSQNVSAGGQLVLTQAFTASMSTGSVEVYASASASAKTETAAVSEGSEGTSLGTATNAVNGNINSMQRALRGSGRYKESAIRQWLNSSGEAGSVWTPQTVFDRPPVWAGTAAGWMNGMDADFLAVLGASEHAVCKSTISDGGGTETVSDTFFLLSKSESYMTPETGSADEGSAYAYYSGFSDLSAAGDGSDSNRIKRSGSAGRVCWLRTPYAGRAYSVRVITHTGSSDSGQAADARYVVPACCII